MTAWTADPRFRRGVVISLGAARSGKTTLGQLISSFEAVDHLDEYWPLMSGAAALAQGLWSTEAFSLYMNAAIAETRTDNALLRTANFRPGDESAIWQTKRWSEIVHRLFILRSRQASADYIGERQHLLVLGATDCVQQLQAFVGACDWAEMLLVVRHPLDVALGASQRGWFADTALSSPVDNMPSCAIDVERLLGSESGRVGIVHLPWWLRPEDYRAFVAGDELLRGLLYWKALHVDSGQLESADSLGAIVVRFNDIIEKPMDVVRGLPFMKGRAATGRTRRLLRKIVPPQRQVLSVSLQARDVLSQLVPYVEAFELRSAVDLVP